MMSNKYQKAQKVIEELVTDRAKREWSSPGKGQRKKLENERMKLIKVHGMIANFVEEKS
tara:strand:+ start:2680 stop:2856 length:177 start_codon:yes stop_codon:yes gene_type:complete